MAGNEPDGTLSLASVSVAGDSTFIGSCSACPDGFATKPGQDPRLPSAAGEDRGTSAVLELGLHAGASVGSWPEADHHPVPPLARLRPENGTRRDRGGISNGNTAVLPTGNEVMIGWAFDIASGTTATTYQALTTLASRFHYTDNKFIPGNIAGGGLTGNLYAPAVVSPTGVFQYEGPSFTASGSTAWWYGQGVYTLSVG
jgi:hypothetical protein